MCHESAENKWEKKRKTNETHAATAKPISCLSKCGLGITASASRQFHHWLHTPSKCCRLPLPWKLICDSWRGRGATKSAYMCVKCREIELHTHTRFLLCQTVVCLWDVCHKALQEVKGWSQGQHGFPHTPQNTYAHWFLCISARVAPSNSTNTRGGQWERGQAIHLRCGVSCLSKPQ